MDKLNLGSLKDRILALTDLYKNSPVVKPTGNVNNHVHTFYSFSPYSPTKAVWLAYQAGLSTVGIMDHDSISGAEEFLEAGEVVGIATTCGVELRADFSKTKLKGKRINNPDQEGIGYLAIHSIPHKNFSKVKEFFSFYREKRNDRNRLMIEKINQLTNEQALQLDFDRDVVSLSRYSEGGSITERHLLFALAKKILKNMGQGEALISWLENQGVFVEEKTKNLLTDPSNPHYEYDLLGLLKGHFIEKIYVPATQECPLVSEVISFAKEIGGILAYAYLGDVGNSVTGDKKAQTFEDAYLDLLFSELKELGFQAVTYMPSRNTKEQLKRLRALCEEHGFMQISGEDINSPRQSFVCEALADPAYQNLTESAWELVRHERGE